MKKLLDAGYELITDVELLQSQLKAKYICVTGTNGKTSTVNLLADILNNNNFENIDLVIVNFYPFENTIKSTKNHNKIIENIDVGGPTMVRSAAKNYMDVVVVTSSNQYEELIEELKKN